MKNKTYTKIKYMLLIVVLLCTHIAWCDNIDPNDDGSKYAYGENIGWLNLGTRDGDVVVADANLTGYVWAENIGWVNLAPNYADPNVGIKNDGTGLLTGYAWGENVGWINFNPRVPGDPNHYGVTVNTEGNFDGWAYGENIGWIHLRATTPVAYGVKTSWTTSLYIEFDDFARFASQWLETGSDLPADLYKDENNIVDNLDLSILVEEWLEKCPPGWPLAH
jgi:hypothetical protein